MSKLKWKNPLYYTRHWPMVNNERSERKEEKEHRQDVEELATWRKKIEMIGIEIKNLDIENETRRLLLRTTFMNSIL